MAEPEQQGPPAIEVVAVTPDDWRSHSRLRLDMLRETPDAFWTTYAEVAHLDGTGWRERIAGQRHFQARLDGRPAGSVGIWDDPEVGPDVSLLVAMYVAPSARGRGVGERLVRTVLDEAARCGRQRVQLEVTSSNAPAIALYRRMGFVETGVSAPHPRKPELQELVMETPVVRAAPGMEG